MTQVSQRSSHPKTVILIGLSPTVVEAGQQQADRENIRILTATDQAQVEAHFDRGRIDAAIMGAGIDLAQRLEIVRTIFERSDTTSVHMKDRASGPQGFGPFVHTVLSAITDGSDAR